MERKNQNSESCRQLTRERIIEALGAACEEVSIIALEECGSTNDEAKKIALDGVVQPVLIVAERQTAGRGRLGRSFYSPARTGLYFSILYPTQASLQSAVSVTGAAAVAVMRAIRSTAGKQTAIKWVNDLYLDGKKVCGILTEALTGIGADARTYLIVGIGVNLTTEHFPTELSEIAGAVGGACPSRAELLAEIWRALSRYLNDPSDRSWLEDYRTHSMVLGRQIEWIRGEERRQGIAEAITEDGELEVLLSSGERELLRTGEISVRLKAIP
ncbi:MAG: biotin--[acetyl-CoA-carboxylase] ligase [Ruminococcaceae bacterium]|nr:biotin--[acetyl-CoA-carboxylase] ligase [Oscillospiraceae bacterium]